MIVLHLFTFDPAWVPASKASAVERIFFDGGCGLCHGFVRFVLAEDRAGAFRFAPLGSRAFEAAVREEERAGLPESVVVVTEEG
ncbi:DUF393 domain-containing protein, partial [bacterium]|nr:DUF393 domain-containing protein [bacterium]